MLQQSRLLRAVCDERDVPCPWCSYNLRGQPFREADPRCPECGKRLHVSFAVGRGAEPRAAAETERTRQRLRGADTLLTFCALIIIVLVVLLMITLVT